MIVILVLIVVVFGVLFLINKNICSDAHPENCNKGCSLDSDCKLDSCTCINKDEKYNSNPNIPTMCGATGCKCINSKCEYANLD